LFLPTGNAEEISLSQPMANNERVWAATPELFDEFAVREPTLATAHVVISGEPEYLPLEPMHALHKFLDSMVISGHVLIKTSTTGQRAATHEVSVGLLTSVVETLLQHVPSNRIILADGPVYARYEDECARLGWASLCRRTGIGVADLNYTDTTNVGCWPVSSLFLEAGAVVSVTRAKTHRRTGVTLGLKSLVGALSGRELGLPKMPGRHRLLNRLLLTLEQTCAPVFSIIDGRNGIEGEGPLSGDLVPSRFVAFGEGLMGPDLRAAVEMGFDPALVPGFLRPWPPQQLNYTPVGLPWSRHRISDVDFLPSLSCSWLYRSLVRTKLRTRRYQHLLSGARACWTEAN
jgi:uncharacterized protein (DUF362 family)